MLRLLYRAMLLDRSRTLLSVLAVAAAIVLVVVLEGVKVGLWQQIRAYPEHLPVHLVATQAGVRNMSAARSVIAAKALEEMQAVTGVREVYPLLGMPVIFFRGDKKTPVYVVGYEKLGGPWHLKAGRNVSVSGELVMDSSLARKHGLAVGDRTELLGKEFRIVGLSEETSSVLNPYLFVPLEDALALTAPHQASQQDTRASAFSFLLVALEPGVDASLARQAIEEAVPSVDVFTPAELANNDVAMIQRLMGSIINLLVAVAYVVGILVIGLTLYTSVFERLREYGIMKAIGARNVRLCRYVLAQAFAFAAMGLAAGFFASLGVAVLITWLAPQYLVVPWDGQVLLRTGIATTLMASVASLLPIRQVASVDPAVVFRQ